MLVTSRVLTAALELIAPTRCAGCERPGVLLCDDCLHQLTLIDPRHACLRCGAPHGDLLCTECATREVLRSLQRCLAVAVFEGPLPHIIRAYKDAGEQRLAPLLAEMLFDAALHAQTSDPKRYGGMLSQADCVVFVPATAAAFRRRGFDHMERIAYPLADLCGLPVLDALVKFGSTDQRRLGRVDRALSAKGCYETVENVCGKNILLIDDVITTGATLDAAASALLEAGAACVEGLALARVLGS